MDTQKRPKITTLYLDLLCKCAAAAAAAVAVVVVRVICSLSAVDDDFVGSQNGVTLKLVSVVLCGIV